MRASLGSWGLPSISRPSLGQTPAHNSAESARIFQSSRRLTLVRTLALARIRLNPTAANPFRFARFFVTNLASHAASQGRTRQRTSLDVVKRSTNVKLVNRLGVLIFTLTILVPVSVELAGQGKGNPKGVDTRDQAEKNDKRDKQRNPIHSVPEPATLLLLGVGAGVAAASKVWQRRRSRTKSQ